MGALPPILELGAVLRSKSGELTSQEAKVLRDCKLKALSVFLVGGSAGGAGVWLATGKLSRFLTVGPLGGYALTSGVWCVKKSLDSSTEGILSLDGSRMQHELAKMIMHGDYPQKKQAISKLFYCEKVFDDSTADHPRSMYRQRNTYVDNAVQIQMMYGSYTPFDGNRSNTKYAPRRDIPDSLGLRSVNLESGQVQVNPSSYVFADPLDCILGYSGTSEEIHHPDNSTAPAKVHVRGRKRLHRMRHHQEELPASEKA